MVDLENYETVAMYGEIKLFGPFKTYFTQEKSSSDVLHAAR